MASELARIEKMTVVAGHIVAGVREERVKPSGHRVTAGPLAAMLCPRTKEGIRLAEEIRPWVMRTCAAAGLPVETGFLYCRDIVANVHLLEEYARLGYDLMLEDADAG